ncbi:MAG: hypothetical protein IIC51_07375 [Planctomycetes bacterium]|nr:hypothetical protein [Planctomycetota bacterium]
MNPIQKYFRVLRLLGPRVVALRCGVYARDLLGITRRTFSVMLAPQGLVARFYRLAGQYAWGLCNVRK